MAHAYAAIPLFGMPGPGEWVVIIAVIVFFFGATKLPQLGHGLGEGLRNFKKGLKGEEEEKTKVPVKVSDPEAGGDTPKSEG